MGVISISRQPERYWQAAGWAFRQVLDDVLHLCPADTDFQSEIEQAKIYDSLSIYAMPKEMAERIIGRLREVAEGILAGTMHSGITSQPFGNSETQAQYKSGLQQLLFALSDPNDRS